MNADPPPQQPENAPGSTDASLGMAPEISRRVASILDAVEREAARLRAEAREEAARYLDESRRRADGLVAERQRRIAALSEELVAKSEAVVARLDDAAPVRQGFENLVRALGDAAERLSHETERSTEEFAAPPFPGAAAGYPQQPQPQHHQPPPPPQQHYAPPLQTHVPPPPQQPYSPPPQPEYAPPPPQPQEHYAESPYAPPPAQPAHQPEPYTAPPVEQPPNGGGGDFDEQPHPARSPATPQWQPEHPPEQPATTGAPGWRELDEAKMVAIQLAATGATRGGVRDHLQRGLGVADPGVILDEVFGVGSREDTRVPWTAEPR